jgi:hypothetical protein
VEAVSVPHLTAEQRAAGLAKAKARIELYEDRIAFAFAPRWAIGEDCRQFILFERTGPDRFEPRSFYNDLEPLLARMAGKPGVYEGAIDWLRGFLRPYHGTGRWFHGFAVFKPHMATGLPAFGDMHAVGKTPKQGPLAGERTRDDG